MITQLHLDESTKLEFAVSVTGADQTPISRFVIECKDFSLSFPCKQVNENIHVDVPSLKGVIPAGEYPVRIEVLIDNKMYVPLKEQMIFQPSVAVETKQKSVVKESVKVSTTVITKPRIDEQHMLRKTQAALIIAQSLNYTPKNQNESPSDVIRNAMVAAGTLSESQVKTLSDMLDLAEAVGIDISNVRKSRQE